jgi:long-chain-fatty-acid--[acyl-carrier-protein] ligase
MLKSSLGRGARALLALRYRVTLVGLDEVVARGRERILLLPNHPALIDPVILAVWFLDPLSPLFLADSQQIDRPILRTLARYYGVRALPDAKEFGSEVRKEVERVLAECARHLQQGGNLCIYPSGHVYRSRHEDLRGNSGAHTLVQKVPDARVVLVRTTGLWGSAFSWAAGREPQLAQALRRGGAGLLGSGVALAPKREVRIELVEAQDLPRRGTREEFNRYLEDFYNQGAPPARYVPYGALERGEARDMPEPDAFTRVRDASQVPRAVREAVWAHLRERSGVTDFADGAKLARDLGLDSLARAELLVWIEKELGVPVADATTMETVADVLLAACGEATTRLARRVVPPHPSWFKRQQGTRISVSPSARTLLEAFLDLADQGLARPLVADQTSGVRSVGDLVTGVFALQDTFRALPGRRLGILLPASVGATLSYLTTLAAEKTPVLVNFTLGPRHLKSSLDQVGVERVITSKLLVERLASRGTDLSSIADKFVFLEDVREKITAKTKLRAALQARVGRSALREVRVTQHAAVLFTSGSEAAPKAVPLTHENLLTNLRDVLSVAVVRPDDCVLGMLPPFHSFGLAVGIGAAIAGGLRVIYHPDPTDGGMLAKLASTYGVSVLVGTPTFVSGIVGAGTRQELSKIRLAVTGAEACSARVYEAIRDRCPNAVILEGYGITECSPVVSLNDERAPVPFTVGKPLPSVRWMIVNTATQEPVPAGETGMLLVRGPSVFDGYLEYDGPSPFVEQAGHLWYRTGDLVCADDEGVLTFRGRLKRFVKIGGEMVSLPAIEAALEEAIPRDASQPGPVLAVVADTSRERPELVLFTTIPLERSLANELLRKAGLSSLHAIRQVMAVESLPVLGTGKTDHRSLEAQLNSAACTPAP